MLHIAKPEDWRAAQESGTYAVPGGVISGCSRAQLPLVVNAHFPEIEWWIVLTIDESLADGEVRMVTFTADSRSETFPHLHGSVPVAAVSEVQELGA